VVLDYPVGIFILLVVGTFNIYCIVFGLIILATTIVFVDITPVGANLHIVGFPLYNNNFLFLRFLFLLNLKGCRFLGGIRIDIIPLLGKAYNRSQDQQA
jgi:hypothetical protein